MKEVILTFDGWCLSSSEQIRDLSTMKYSMNMENFLFFSNE